MTLFTDIYDKHLSLIEDETFLSLDIDVQEEALEDRLAYASALGFRECRQSLALDKDNKQFTVDLTEEEQWILAHAMVITWTSKKLKSEKLLKQRLGSLEYKQYSPANHLDKLNSLYSDIKKEVKVLKREYQYYYKYSQS